MKIYTYGAMSTSYEITAPNKFTAYAAMVYHYQHSAHLIALYEPKDEVKDDSWMSFTGQISEKLDEIFGGENSFDEYVENNIEEIRTALKTIKQLIQ